MIKIKRKLFFRSFFISFIAVFCIIFGIWATAKAYENIRLVAYGEYTQAFEIHKDGIRIFDFEIKI